MIDIMPELYYLFVCLGLQQIEIHDKRITEPIVLDPFCQIAPRGYF